MPIRTQDPILRYGDQIQTQSSLQEEVAASFNDALQSTPIVSLKRMMEIDDAEYGREQSSSSIARFGYLPNATIRPSTPKLSRADAQQRIRDAGLEGRLTVPEASYRSRTLEILIERKREELKRETIYQQSPGGVGRVGARVASSFIGSLVDPTNVALAFVPVVGEARYAALLARAGGVAGRTAVRVGVGGAEGLVGAAIAEPLNYYANRQQQADYDVYDAMSNIAGGLFFGSALHAGAGLFGDMVRPGKWSARPRAAEEITAPGVDTAAVGRTDPLQFDPRDLAIQRERAIVLGRLAEGRPLTRAQAIARASDTMRADIESELIAASSGVAEPGAIAAARADLSAVTKELSSLESERRALTKRFNQQPNVGRKQAEAMADEALTQRRADLEGRKSRAEAQIAVNKNASDAVSALSAFRERGEIPEAWRSKVETEADRLLGSDGQQPLSKAVTDAIEQDRFAHVRPFVAGLPADAQQNMFRMALAQAVTGRPIDVTPGILGYFGDVKGAAEAAMRNAREVAGADHMASQAADARLAAARPGEDLAALTEAANEADSLFREQAKAAGIDEEMIASMTESADDAMQQAKAKISAVKIAALCSMRAG